MISWLNNPACTYPCQRFATPLARRRRMTRGRRGSLPLRRRALPSPPPCRFIPALSPNTTSPWSPALPRPRPRTIAERKRTGPGRSRPGRSGPGRARGESLPGPPVTVAGALPGPDHRDRSAPSKNRPATSGSTATREPVASVQGLFHQEVVVATGRPGTLNRGGGYPGRNRSACTCPAGSPDDCVVAIVASTNAGGPQT